MPFDAKPLHKTKEKKPHQGRRAPRNKFYDSAVWRKTSKAYRKQNPICECEKCKELNRVLPAHDTDHIKPINPLNPYDTQNGKFGDPLDYDNLQAINRRCHARKSAKERHNQIIKL